MSPVSTFPIQPRESPPPHIVEVQKQSLFDYLTAFGLASQLTQEEKLLFIACKEWDSSCHGKLGIGGGVRRDGREGLEDFPSARSANLPSVTETASSSMVNRFPPLAFAPKRRRPKT